MKGASLPLAALALASCASVSPKSDFEDVSRLVRDRGGPEMHWDEGVAADDQVKARVQQLVLGKLDPEDAVEVALLRNQGLVAQYEQLGIAQADLVQAGLLTNPSFGARVRFPSGSGSIDTEFSLAQDFLDLLTVPLRKKVAAAQLEATKARVGQAVLELTAQVRTAIVTLQAAQATAEVRRLILDAQAAAAELRRRQHAAGNVSDLDLAQEDEFYQRGKIDLARAETQVLEDREHVNRLLGLWGAESASWSVESAMATLPEKEASLEHIESLAIARRLDLAAARSELQSLEEAASLARLFRVLPAIQIGVSTESDTEGNRVTGPQLSVELPIFDQGRGRAARLASQLRQAQARESELAVNVRAEARAVRIRLLATRGVAEHYRTVLLPLRERIVKESQLRYNANLLGVFRLLLARQDQIEGYRDYLEAVRDYWTTRAELERVAGGSLVVQSDQVSQEKP